MNLRPTLLALQACLVAATAFAQPAQNPPGFTAPDGHYPEKTDSLSFGLYEKHDTFICQPQKKKCSEQDPGFTAKGTAAAEGPMVTTAYKRSDGQKIEGLNMQRNYERVVREMGGRLLAVMQGHDPGRGYMRQVHLLERNGQRQWIMVDTWGDSTRLLVTVVTLGDAPSRAAVPAPAQAAPATAPGAAPAASGTPAQRVQVVPPDALLDFLKVNPRVVVLFTSPSSKCGYCVGADKTFEEVAALLGGDWRYVRTEWSPWKQFPPIAVDAGVLGIPDHVVFRSDRAPAHVSGRIKDARELGDKIRAVQAQP
jgi:hypothetical protein